MDDVAFLETLADELFGLGGVEGVALGGSRAQGSFRPDSDWDLAVYYRGDFDPAGLRALGHPGEVSELGGWGGGVFNGGAWLRVGDRAVDVHYRDIASVEHEIAEAQAGRMRAEPLAFHLAGIPSYLVVAELAASRTLRGTVPAAIPFPAALRPVALAHWWSAAQLNFSYARTAHAPAGRVAQCLAMLTVAASFAAHAVLAARGEWVTNEKTLLDRAGLRGIDVIVARVAPDAAGLQAACGAVEVLCTDAVIAAQASAGSAKARA